MTISGRGLESATAVSFGSTPAASFTINEDGSITAASPPLAGGFAAEPVTVDTPEGVSITRELPDILPANYFIYGPTVTSVTPSSGPATGGTKVTIQGTGFFAALPNPLLGPPFVRAVYFGSTPLSCGVQPHYWPCEPMEFEVDSETEITAVAPAGTGTVDVTVQTTGGTSPTSSADLFAYAAPEDTPGPESGDMVQLMNCRAVKRSAVKSVRRQRRAAETAVQICTSKLVSGSVGAGPLAARLMRGDVLYATGTATVSHANTRLELEPLRRVMPGRYRLTLASRRGLRHESITVR